MNHWLSTMILGPAASATPSDDSASDDDETVMNGNSKTQENRLLLQSLTSYIVKENRLGLLPCLPGFILMNILLRIGLSAILERKWPTPFYKLFSPWDHRFSPLSPRALASQN